MTLHSTTKGLTSGLASGQPAGRELRPGVSLNAEYQGLVESCDGTQSYKPGNTFPDINVKRLGLPVLLMNVPFSLSAAEPNNKIMEGLSTAQRQIDKRKAMSQFLMIYQFVAQHAIVYLLPSRPGLQDQTYVSNIGAVLPHLNEEVVVVSRFRTQPRRGETSIGFEFFKLLNFNTFVPPSNFGDDEPLYFEGEADLKYIRDNIYIGAHGMRSSRSALRWLSSCFNMKIIPVMMCDPLLYHLDCCLLPLDKENVIFCTSIADRSAIRAVESHCNVIDVSLEGAYSGVTNSAVIGRHLLCDSTIDELRKTDPYYRIEKLKIDKLGQICCQYDLELRIFQTSEFYKSGAALSCLLMRLN